MILDVLLPECKPFGLGPFPIICRMGGALAKPILFLISPQGYYYHEDRAMIDISTAFPCGSGREVWSFSSKKEKKKGRVTSRMPVTGDIESLRHRPRRRHDLAGGCHRHRSGNRRNGNQETEALSRWLSTSTPICWATSVMEKSGRERDLFSQGQTRLGHPHAGDRNRKQASCGGDDKSCTCGLNR